MKYQGQTAELELATPRQIAAIDSDCHLTMRNQRAADWRPVFVALRGNEWGMGRWLTSLP
jgi:hypothetical protein